MSSRVPGWLKVHDVEGKRVIRFKEGGKEIIQRIFRETAHGLGRRTIAARLKNAGYTPFEGGERWQPSYIKKVLENRAAIGELQAFRRNDEGRRVPAGMPIKGYYPAAISEARFIAANTAKTSRKTAAGRRGPTGVRPMPPSC